MSEQLESVTQDTEIQDCAEEITGTLEAAFDLLLDRRDRQYAAAIKPLDKEAEQLAQESTAISEAAQNLEALLPAKAREAQRQADVLLLAGKGEEAQAKIAEAREAASAPQTMTQRQREITARVEAIEAEKSEVKARCDEAFYSEAQQIVRATERGFFTVLMDGIEEVLLPTHLGRNTNTWLNLTCDTRSPEWRSGTKWYGGR